MICKGCNEPIDLENHNIYLDEDGDYMHSACYCQSKDADFFTLDGELEGNESNLF